jgi:hypothetical protein
MPSFHESSDGLEAHQNVFRSNHNHSPIFRLPPAPIPTAAPIPCADIRINIQAVIILPLALLARRRVSTPLPRIVVLAALGIDVDAAVVLRLASVLAALRDGALAVRGTLRGVGFSVELETGAGVVFRWDVVAG